jgi:RNA polymerase sigma-70 factor, ECF subfamily
MNLGTGQMASNVIPSLLAKARQSDGKAFEALLLPFEERLAWVIVRKLRATVHRDDDAEDILQETRRKAWDALRGGSFEYESDAQFWSWLARIAINCVYDLLRRNGRNPSQMAELRDEQQVEITLEEHSPGSLLAHHERSAGVQQILSQMPPTMRDVVVLRMEGLSFADIAKRLQVGEGTARMRHFRAGAYLRASPAVHHLCRDWSSIALPENG